MIPQGTFTFRIVDFYKKSYDLNSAKMVRLNLDGYSFDMARLLAPREGEGRASARGRVGEPRAKA